MTQRRLLTPAILAGLLGLAACAPQQPMLVQQQQACDTSFRVVNASSGTVERLYFSHASQSGWGNDQLGQNILAPGRSTSYRAANVGAYDFRTVWANGRSAELRRVNVCAASTITVTDQGLRAS